MQTGQKKPTGISYMKRLTTGKQKISFMVTCKKTISKIIVIRVHMHFMFQNKPKTKKKFFKKILLFYRFRHENHE